MGKEDWKDVVGYKGLYKVNRIGQVLSVQRKTWLRKCDFYKNGHFKTVNKRILKRSINPKGYMFVRLYKNYKRKSLLVHRLVNTAFTPNPKNYPQTNHKDGDRSNNHVDNLEWCTASQNIKHSFTVLNRKVSKVLR